jgi:hypothetical protein
VKLTGSAFCCGLDRLSRVPLPLVVVFAFALCLTSALALSQVKSPFMSVAELRPGMKGYGLTVFRGDAPERFGVEVIDVLHGFRPDQDLILIRTEHPVLTTAITVAGMSGSPIYIDGRMIGAYAYGWTFGKEPVAGVTPISNMLAELARPIDPRIWKAIGTLPALTGHKPAAPSPQAQLRPYLGDRREAAFDALRALPRNTLYGQPLPAATPLQVSGLGQAGLELLSRELGPYGLMPVQAGAGAGAAASSKPPAPFQDGGSIGVQLTRGDVSVMAVGTVTYVQGQKLVAFGHPMLNAGQVALPTCTTKVVHVLSSEMRSFKLAEPVAPLGVLVQDRQSAIVVDSQLHADMLPVKVRVHGVPNAPRTEWNMEVASHRMLTPGLVMSALSSALEATAIDRTDAVLQVDSQVEIAGHGKQSVSDVLVTSGGASDGGALGRLRAFSLLAAAYGNPFESARVTAVQLDVHVRFERDLLSVVDASLPSDTVDPGSTVQLAVTLRGFDAQDGKEEVRIFPIEIPSSAAGETLELSIEPGDEVDLERPKPSSLDDILRAVRLGYPGTSLVVSTKLPGQGVKLRGQLVRSLPGSALDSLQPANEADKGALFPSYERKELALGHPVAGSMKLKLNVRAEPLR